jgi:hypothetical protein
MPRLSFAAAPVQTTPVTRVRTASSLPTLRSLAPVLTLAAGALVLGSGCRGKDISFDCENQRSKFDDRASGEELPLVAEVPEKGPYPVAMQLTGAGVNKLLASIIDEEVPFAGTVPFGVLPQGPADAAFEPTSLPTIALTKVPGCPNCVVFHLDFGVQLSSPDMDLSSGAGFVDLYVPLRLDVDAAAGKSRLIADYGAATIGDWYLQVFGFDSDTHTMLAGALKLLLAEEIATNYDELLLLEVGSWEVGDGAVTLLVRDLVIDSDADKLVLAMHTNLPLGKGVGLDLAGALPEGSTMAVSMDPGLLLPMAHQMLAEGNIARIYDEDGNPDPSGIYGVTLEQIEANAAGNESLDSTFRVWRVDEGYCGYAEAVMPLTLAVDPNDGSIDVTPGDAVLVAGEGSGAAALEEKQLVNDNQDLIQTFRADLATQLADALNFSALDIEDSSLVFTNEGIELTPDEMRTYLNFTVYADE